MNSVEQVMQHLLSTKGKSIELVLIGGCSRAGKSQLTRQLQRRLQEQGFATQHLELDSWIVSLESRKSDSTVFDRYEKSQIQEAILGLLQGRQVSIPQYDSKSRRRVSESGQKMQIESGWLLVEGVVALAYPEIRHLAKTCIFVDINDDRRHLRLREFYLEEKGLSLPEFDALMREREREEVPQIKATAQFAQIVYSAETSV